MLTEKLLHEKDAESAFIAYYNERIDAIKEHLFLGRDLKVKFCDPAQNDQDEIKIPLIEKYINRQKTWPQIQKSTSIVFHGSYLLNLLDHTTSTKKIKTRIRSLFGD